MREDEIQHKRISFQLIRETHGLIRVLLDNLGRAFRLSGLFCSSLLNWADIPLSREKCLESANAGTSSKTFSDLGRPGQWVKLFLDSHILQVFWPL